MREDHVKPSKDHHPPKTILVVDDDLAVQDLVCEVLQIHGYKVLTAGSVDGAQSICREKQIPIDLLVTDVFMPEMTGRELADQLHRIRPNLKVLFISGFSETIMVNGGTLQPGSKVLEKPFTVHALAGKVHDILDDPR